MRPEAVRGSWCPAEEGRHACISRPLLPSPSCWRRPHRSPGPCCIGSYHYWTGKKGDTVKRYTSTRSKYNKGREIAALLGDEWCTFNTTAWIMRIFVHPLWVNSLNLNNNNGKSAGQKLGQTDTQWTNTMARPPFQWEKKKREIPELTSKFQAQHIYYCTITMSSWNYLAGPTHSHMHVYYLQRTHTLQRQLYAATGEGERGRGWTHVHRMTAHSG